MARRWWRWLEPTLDTPAAEGPPHERYGEPQGEVILPRAEYACAECAQRSAFDGLVRYFLVETPGYYTVRGGRLDWFGVGPPADSVVLRTDGPHEVAVIAKYNRTVRRASGLEMG